MFPGAIALLERSLRIDARALLPHAIRGGLIVAIYGGIMFALISTVLGGGPGAPGFQFFCNITYLNLTAMTLIGSSYFATPITEEKEEDTLGMMLMTGITPLGILLGKTGSRLAQAMLLTAVQIPPILLSVTLGGVTLHQIIAAQVAVFAYIVLLAGVGLLLSTISPGNRLAAYRMTTFLLIYWLLPLFCSEVLTNSRTLNPFTQKALTAIAQFSVFQQIGTVLTTGFNESAISVQVVSNLIAGIICFCGSWFFFDTANSSPQRTDATDRVLERKGWLAPGRPKIEPIVWKDFYFLHGGPVALVIRFVLWISLYLVLAWLQDGSIINVPLNNSDVTSRFLIMMTVATTFDAGLCASRAMSEEFQVNSWPTLLLARSANRILLDKWIAAIFSWSPTPICLFLAIELLPYGQLMTTAFLRRIEFLGWLLPHLLLVPHVTAVWATYVRWGALPLGIMTTIASFYLMAIFFWALDVRGPSVAIYVYGVGTLAVCVKCHYLLYHRALRSATRS